MSLTWIQNEGADADAEILVELSELGEKFSELGEKLGFKLLL